MRFHFYSFRVKNDADEFMIVVFQWLSLLVAPRGDMLLQKLQAIEAGYQRTGNFGKRQLMRKKQNESDMEVLVFLADLGGFLEIE